MKFLLLTTIGNNDQWYQHWFKGKRNFDVGLICYEQTTAQMKLQPDFYFWHLPDFKYPALYQVIASNKFIFDYDYIFMPDDDVLMDTASINTLFDWAFQKGMLLAQPSITNKNVSWLVTLNHPDSQHRLVKMVEIMCPIFSSYALSACWQTFKESYSGWGLDAVWGKILNYHKIAVCDLVIASHEKPMNEGSGRLYEKLRNEKNITDPRIEMQHLLKKYDAPLDFSEYARVPR